MQEARLLYIVIINLNEQLDEGRKNVLPNWSLHVIIKIRVISQFFLRKRQMNDKKTQILKAAIRLFANDGVGVATSKIAKEASVSNGTLFNYFKTKQALIDEVYFYIKEKISNEIISDLDEQKDVKAVFKEIWSSYTQWALEHEQEYKVLGLLKSSQLLSDDVLQASEHLFSYALSIMENAIHEKSVIDAPIPLICEITGAQANAVIEYICHNNIKKADIQGIIETSFKIHWEGIGQ